MRIIVKVSGSYGGPFCLTGPLGVRCNGGPMAPRSSGPPVPFMHFADSVSFWALSGPSQAPFSGLFGLFLRAPIGAPLRTSQHNRSSSAAVGGAQIRLLPSGRILRPSTASSLEPCGVPWRSYSTRSYKIPSSVSMNGPLIPDSSASGTVSSMNFTGPSGCFVL